MFLSTRNSWILSTPCLVTFSDMPISSVIIFLTLSFFVFSWLNIIRTVNGRSPHATCLTHSLLTSVLFVEGLSLLDSTFVSSQLSLNLLCQSETHVHDMMLSPNNLEAFQMLVTVFSNWTKISGLFIPQCSELKFLKKRRNKPKQVKKKKKKKKKIIWLLRAKISYILLKIITQFASPSFAHSSHRTSSSINFQTDLVHKYLDKSVAYWQKKHLA